MREFSEAPCSKTQQGKSGRKWQGKPDIHEPVSSRVSIEKPVANMQVTALVTPHAAEKQVANMQVARRLPRKTQVRTAVVRAQVRTESR